MRIETLPLLTVEQLHYLAGPGARLVFTHGALCNYPAAPVQMKPPNNPIDSVDLPAAWVVQFNGTDLETKLHVAAVLGTVDDAGWPYLAYLSVGEVLAHSSQRLSVALWPSSHSTANLQRVGRGAIHAVADGAIWEARLIARPREGVNELVVFDAEIVEV